MAKMHEVVGDFARFGIDLDVSSAGSLNASLDVIRARYGEDSVRFT